MARKCQICGKGIMRGHNVSHAKNRSKKKYKPNLKTRKIKLDGKLQKITICNKCLKRLKKDKKAEKKSA